MDLLTFLRLGKRLRRLVTVFVLVARLRLANEYYTIGVNIYFEKKRWLVLTELCSDDCKCNQANQANYT